MKAINIHRRTINQPHTKLAEMFQTLATENDLVVAKEKWSPVVLDRGLQVGSTGGHGPIGYTVEEYAPGKLIKFRFTKPAGFNGIHKFEILDLGNNQTELIHTIDMHTSGVGSLKWLFAVRWLHDAFMEDAFDKVENHFSEYKKTSKWSTGVKLLRWLLKPRKK